MNDRFDALLRARHAQALDALSPRTRTQLHNRLHAALAGPAHRPRRLRAWIPAAALAAALALWLPWRGTQAPVAPPPAPQAAGDDTLATLDETPDFYLWLASDDAVALASE